MVSQFHRYLFSLKNRFTSPAKVIAGRGFSSNLKGGSGSRSSIFMKLLQELPGGYDSLSRENARQAGDMSVRPLNQLELESYLRAWLLSIGTNSGGMNLTEMKYEMKNIAEFLNELKAHYHMGNFSGDDMARVVRLIKEGSETEARLQRRIAELEAQKAEYVRITESLTRQLASTASPQEASKIESDLEQIKAETTKLEGDKDETMLHLRNPKLDTLDEEMRSYVLAILTKLREEDPLAYLQNTLTDFLAKINTALDERNTSQDVSEIEEGLMILRNQLQEYLGLLRNNPSASAASLILKRQFDQTSNPKINDLMLEIASTIFNIVKVKESVLPDTARLRQMLQERMFTAPENDADLAAFICDNVLQKYDAQNQRIEELEAQVRDLSSQVVKGQTEIQALEGENMAFRTAVVRWINQLSAAKDVHEKMSWATLIDRMNGLLSQLDTKTKTMFETSSAQSGGQPEPSVRDAISIFMAQIIGAFKNYADGIASLSDPATTVAAGTTKAGMARHLSTVLYNDIRGIQNLPAVIPLVQLYPNFGLDLSTWLEQIQGIVENYNRVLDKSVNFYSVIEQIAGILGKPVTNMQVIIDGVKELSKGSNELFKAQMQQLQASLAQLQKENETMASSLSAYTSMGTTQKIQEELNRNAQQISRISELEQELSRLQSQLKSTESTVQRLTPSSSGVPPVPPPTPLNSSIYDESTIGLPPSNPPSSYSIPSVPSVPPPPLPSASSEMGDEEIAPGYKKDIDLGVQALAQNTGRRFLDDLYELRALMADIYATPKIRPLEKAELANHLNVEIVRVLLYPKGIWPFSPDNRLQTRRYYIMLPILSRVGLAAAFNYMKAHPEDKLTQDLYEGYGKVILGTLKRVNFLLSAFARLSFSDLLYDDPTTIFSKYNDLVEEVGREARAISLGSGATSTRARTPILLSRAFYDEYVKKMMKASLTYDLMDWIRTLWFYCKNDLVGSFWQQKYLPFIKETCQKIAEVTTDVLESPKNMMLLVSKGFNPIEANKKIKIPYGYFYPFQIDPAYKNPVECFKI